MNIVKYYNDKHKDVYDKKEANEYLKEKYNINLLCDICSNNMLDCGQYCAGSSFKRSVFLSLKLKIKNKIFDWLDK